MHNLFCERWVVVHSFIELDLDFLSTDRLLNEGIIIPRKQAYKHKPTITVINYEKQHKTNNL